MLSRALRKGRIAAAIARWKYDKALSAEYGGVRKLREVGYETVSVLSSLSPVKNPALATF